MIRGIIFDFDGVLVNSELANIRAAVKTFEDLNAPLTKKEERCIPGRASMDFIPEFAKKRGIRDEAEHRRMYEVNRDNYNALWGSVVKIFPENEQAIDTLFSQGKKLAIATTNRRETVEMFFDIFGMRDKFSVIVTGEDVKSRKPDPEAYLLAAQRLGLPKEELIAVEDTSIGLQAAKRAGLRCAVVPNEYTEKEDFYGADHILRSLAGLREIY